MAKRKRLDEGAVVYGLLGAMWVVEGLNLLLGHSLNALGITPRTWLGIAGIPLAPFLHGGVGHLAVNSFPFLILAWLVTLGEPRRFVRVTVTIILCGGALVWLFGRGGAAHVGASGLVFGYFGYVMTRGFTAWSFQSTLAALTSILLYGGLVYSLLPGNPLVSWESHLSGALAGVAAAWPRRRRGRRRR